MTPPVDQVDQELASLRRAADAATFNLMEIETMGSLALIRAATFEGASAEPVGAAVASLDRLLQYTSCLLALVDEAEHIRRQGRPNRPRMVRLDELLHGPAVALPPRAVELDERALFDPAEVNEQVTVAQLLAWMEEDFVDARDTLCAVDDIWEHRIAETERLQARLASFGSEAAELGEPADATAPLSSALEAVAGDLLVDPLGAAATLDGLASEVERFGRRVERLEASRRSLPADLVAARTRLSSLRRAVAAVDVIHDEVQRRIAHPPAVGTVPADLLSDPRRGLVPWLDRLDDLLADGRWRAARVGLDRWSTAAASAEATCHTLHDLGDAPLARLRELDGLLQSYRAKAGTGASGAIAAAEAAAVAALASHPVDLADAGEAVAAYVDAVRAAR